MRALVIAAMLLCAAPTVRAQSLDEAPVFRNAATLSTATRESLRAWSLGLTLAGGVSYNAIPSLSSPEVALGPQAALSAVDCTHPMKVGLRVPVRVGVVARALEARRASTATVLASLLFLRPSSEHALQ